MLLSGTIAAAGLYLLRTTAMVLAAPILGSSLNASAYRIGLIVSLTSVFYMASGSPMQTVPAPLVYAAMAGRELVIGFFMAFVLHTIWLATRVAGELLGNEMGFSMASTADPISGQNVPVLAQIYEILLALVMFGVNGHHWLLRAFSVSFQRAPVGDLELSPDLASTAIRLVGELFEAGVAFGAPVLVLLFLVSLLIGLLARTVPQLNIMEFGFNMRIGVALVALFALSPLLAPAMDRLLGHLTTGLESALDALGS